MTSCLTARPEFFLFLYVMLLDTEMIGFSLA